MERRRLGNSDLEVPAFGLGTGTFGGSGPVFSAWGNTDVDGARRLIDVCLDAGCNFFDTADAYSGGASEQILGEALANRRNRAIVATKIGLPTGGDLDDRGHSVDRLMRAVDGSLKRLQTDYIDLLQMHAFDAATPADELLRTLQTLIESGKVRHVGASNYPAWQLMKSLALADLGKGPRFVSHQVYYSLIGRDYEAELMPLGVDQNLSAIVWSPLGWGRLTGRLRPGQPPPQDSRQHHDQAIAPHVAPELLQRVLACIEKVAGETSRTVPQVALNWLSQRPTVTTVIIGARNEAQLRDNLGATGWSLSEDQIARLDAASAVRRCYPHSLYSSGPFALLNPPVV